MLERWRVNVMVRVLLLLLVLVVALGCNAINWLSRMPQVGQLFAAAAIVSAGIAIFAYLRGLRG
jgi:hypothetical protein